MAMGMMKVNATQLWDQDVRRVAQDVMLSCKTDSVLPTMLESMIIKVDSDIVIGRPFADRLEGIHNVLNGKNYYDNAHKRTPDAEVAKIKDFAERLAMLVKIAQYEFRIQPMEPEVKETIKSRLPNSDPSMEKVYGKQEIKSRID